MGGSSGVENAVRNYAAVVTGGKSEALLGANEELVERPKKQAEEAAKKQIAQQEALEAGVREQDVKNEAVEERNKARNQQKAMALKSQGRRSTILTSPLGVVGEESGSRKTLLGM